MFLNIFGHLSMVDLWYAWSNLSSRFSAILSSFKFEVDIRENVKVTDKEVQSWKCFASQILHFHEEGKT